MQYSYQQMLPEALAIVCSVKYQDCQVFRLTEPYGINTIRSCKVSVSPTSVFVSVFPQDVYLPEERACVGGWGGKGSISVWISVIDGFDFFVLIG